MVVNDDEGDSTKKRKRPRVSRWDEAVNIQKKLAIHAGADVVFLRQMLGPYGRCAARINLQTGCEVALSLDAENFHILIQGTDEGSVDRAYMAARDILIADENTKAKMRDEYAIMEDPMFAPTGSTIENPDLIIRIPNQHVGLIIGRGGETIKTIQQTTGCRLQVAKEPTKITNERAICITGLHAHQSEAKSMIENLLTDHTLKKRTAPERLLQLLIL
eukprot:GHVL01033677.1.p1 GENE.GHVL01033677.1~~GHVL01033677.1.p1  ORF type:complete len:225 (+),score=32.34 GHVL01033677.1:23-676(+)